MSDREVAIFVGKLIAEGSISKNAANRLAHDFLAALSAAGRLREEVTGDVVEAATDAVMRAFYSDLVGDALAEVRASARRDTGAAAPAIAAAVRAETLEEAAMVFDVEAAHATAEGLGLAAEVFTRHAELVRALKDKPHVD